MATSELLNSHSLTASLGGQKVAIREFHVEMPVDAAMALINNNSPIPGVPKRGENHPYLFGLYCQTLDARDAGNGITCVISAMYGTSNVARFHYAEPDITGSNWVRGITFQRVNTEIPFAVKVPYTYSGANGTQQTKSGWIIKTKPVRETRIIFEARWRLVNPSLSGAIADFYEQDDKVHEIHGVKYVFNVGSITPIDNQFYEVNAQWTADFGTRDPVVEAYDQTTRRLPQDMIYQPSKPLGFIRTPFHHLTSIAAVDPNANNGTEIPRLALIADYQEDLTGWQGLPQIPNL